MPPKCCVLKGSLQHRPDRRTVMSSIRRLRGRFSEAEKQTIWDLCEAGVPVKRIARHLGRQNVSLRKFIADAGGKRPSARGRSELRLSLAEREEISRGLAAGDSGPSRRSPKLA